MFFGTTINTTVVRVVDGDTVRLQAGDREQSVRLLALDTEESNRGSATKPVTPWGQEAKKEAQRLLPAGGAVTLEFPGNEPLEECWEKHRDNFGRLLGFVHKDGLDVQEHMIRQGYSPLLRQVRLRRFPRLSRTLHASRAGGPGRPSRGVGSAHGERLGGK